MLKRGEGVHRSMYVLIRRRTGNPYTLSILLQTEDDCKKKKKQRSLEKCRHSILLASSSFCVFQGHFGDPVPPRPLQANGPGTLSSLFAHGPSCVFSFFSICRLKFETRSRHGHTSVAAPGCEGPRSAGVSSSDLPTCAFWKHRAHVVPTAVPGSGGVLRTSHSREASKAHCI